MLERFRRRDGDMGANAVGCGFDRVAHLRAVIGRTERYGRDEIIIYAPNWRIFPARRRGWRQYSSNDSDCVRCRPDEQGCLMVGVKELLHTLDTQAEILLPTQEIRLEEIRCKNHSPAPAARSHRARSSKPSPLTALTRQRGCDASIYTDAPTQVG